MNAVKKDYFKRYLGYLFKTTLLQNIALTVVAVVFLVDNLDYTLTTRNWGLHSVSWIIILLSFIMPILTFSDMNNKRKLDTLYSLPISRKELVLAKYLYGAISTSAIYTVVYCIYTVNSFAVRSSHGIRMGAILLFYIISLIYGIVMYTFYTFIFTKANTTADGIIFCLFWSFIVGLILFSAFFLMYTNFDLDDANGEFIFSGIVQFPLYCSASVVFYSFFKDGYGLYSLEKICFLVGYPLWTLISICCGISFIKSFPKKAADKAGNISSEIFGYKFLVPASGFSGMILSHNAVVLSAIFLILMIIGYIIYRRGVKFHKSDLLFIVMGIVWTVMSALKI